MNARGKGEKMLERFHFLFSLVSGHRNIWSEIAPSNPSTVEGTKRFNESVKELNCICVQFSLPFITSRLLLWHYVNAYSDIEKLQFQYQIHVPHHWPVMAAI